MKQYQASKTCCKKLPSEDTLTLEAELVLIHFQHKRPEANRTLLELKSKWPVSECRCHTLLAILTPEVSLGRQ